MMDRPRSVLVKFDKREMIEASRFESERESTGSEKSSSERYFEAREWNVIGSQRA